MRQKRFIAGMMLGAVATMLMAPEMDRKTKRKMKRTARYMRGMAQDAYDGMARYMR
ncbi:YtxH domain-containing protein [Clostridium cochlearium]|jgi:gas vesicle protein|uniref:Gas vesicle protein n=1 Tax=Clostridium cochlearium TaxID=1494 RepID=A0A239ZBW3_CLOCO|nr:YtxH domain-containing protein [Clostridium cochlearium]MBV1820105.1 YtxH domain-containing protein [Bacteroidales bacterium MSK.15.36]NSJ91397.1 YtxH domain-containing protein [Coprococcus sp. MSK.21.13]MBE6065402.1 YtxH domain-containing protein [Clostridium cochlearium]MBU5269893.1 YtxH domain-containing protein [Clostridium cochlearium]MCG4572367.1 YtxH domain-containing protein [Clostridium cochlearium]